MAWANKGSCGCGKKDVIDKIDDILKEKETIEESSIARVYNQIQDSKKDWTLITAELKDLSNNENRKRNVDLRNNLVLEAGKGVYRLNGVWRYCKDESIKDIKKCPQEQILEKLEHPFLLIKPDTMTSEKFEKWIYSLIKTFKQQAALIKLNGIIYNFWDTGEKEKIGDRATFQEIEDLYTAHPKNPNAKFKFI